MSPTSDPQPSAPSTRPGSDGLAKGTGEVVLVKLGGSLITDKARDAHARDELIGRLAAELAESLPRLDAGVVLGHGSGSFGHVAAERHGLGDGLRDGDPRAAAAVRQAAARLHHVVMEALLDAGVPAWSWAPSTAVVGEQGRPAAADVDAFFRVLELGMVPVTYGDVVADRSWGAAVTSTEAVLSYLVARLRRRGKTVRRVLWLGETDGVYDASGDTVPEIDAETFAEARGWVGGSRGTDVTGGMLLRLDTARDLARLGIESWIVDGRRPGLLAAGLEAPAGGKGIGAGTRFVADPVDHPEREAADLPSL